MPSSLGRRPQATVFSVEDLVMRVRRGEVRVPKFQRRLNWRAEDIKLLFDSIYRGYPIGSLLFWKREAPADSVKLGPITVDAPASRDAWWVVDGQQRITSLVGALLHSDPVHGRDEYALGIDLETEEFVRSRRALPRSWMPLSVVLDTTKLLSWLDAYPLRSEKPAHVMTAHRVAKALRDYQLPAYVIEEEDEALVREVFGRLNSSGRKLKADEVFDALAGTEAGKGSTLQAISDAVADLGFGRFERTWIHKAVLAVGGVDFTRAGDLTLRPASIKDAHAAAKRALRDVAVFLRRDAALQHLSLLPYGLPIPLLARFFHRHPSPRARSRDLLARWVWRGSITGDHQGESIPEVRSMLSELDQPEEDAVQALLQHLSGPPMDPGLFQLAPFAWKTARTKVEASALLELGPRDLTTGTPIPISEVLSELGPSSFRQLFPISMRHLERTDRKGMRATPWGTLANRFLYHTEETFRLLLTRAIQSPEAASLLRSHAIDLRAAKKLLDPSADTFLAQAELIASRNNILIGQIERFIASRTRWHETDRPSIESLIIPDTEPADA